MKISDLGLSPEYEKICELMFAGDSAQAYMLIEKYENRKELMPLLCIAAVESLWRNDESDRSWEYLRPQITAVQEECLRHSACFFVWWGIFSLRLAESVKADPEFPLAPFWKEIILLVFFKSGWGGGTCYNYGLLSASLVLDHILIKQVYMTDISDFFLDDLLDELASLNTDTLNMNECPFRKTTFKTWTNPYVTSLLIWEGIPYRAMRVLKKAFPNWSKTEILGTADGVLKSAQEWKAVGNLEQSEQSGRYALNLLRLIPTEYRKRAYYKKRKQAYIFAGRMRMADICSQAQ